MIILAEKQAVEHGADSGYIGEQFAPGNGR
jgi:hypothetical protein